MRPTPLPESLLGRPFSAAEAADLGIAPQRLRRADLVHPAHGVHASTPPVTWQDLAAAMQVALPGDAAFSHVTAALIWGLPLPARLEAQRDLDVIVPTVRNRVRRPDVIGHRGAQSRSIETVSGLRVTGLVDTWCDLGEVVRRGWASTISSSSVTRWSGAWARQLPMS